MGRTNYKYSIPVLMFLMALVLIGWPVLEFMVVAVVTIAIGAALLYTFLSFAYGMDRIIDYFYEAR